MKYSIVVPIYNIEEYLRECIESILRQSYKDFELILVNDGSSDGSLCICEEYAKNDSRIVLINKENQGLVRARQDGFRASSGEYIIPVDGDDFIDHRYLSEIDRILSDSNVEIICFGYHTYYTDSMIQNERNGVKEGRYVGNDLDSIRQMLLYDPNCKSFNRGSIIYSLWSKVIKRELYEKCQMIIPSGIRIGEDVAVVMSAVMLAKSVYISNRPYYYYRQISSSMMNSFREEEYQRYVILFDFLEKNVPIYSSNKKLYMYFLIKLQILKSINHFKKRNDFSEYFDRVFSVLKQYKLNDIYKDYHFNMKEKFIFYLISRKYKSLLWYLWKLNNKLKF